MSLKRKIPNLKTLIVLVFGIRLILSLLPPMSIDHTAWRAWSARMVEVGPTKFYSPDIFTANPPGFLYVFWLLGEIKNSLFPQLSFFSSGYDFMLKLPNNFTDLAAGVLIYLIIKKKLGHKLGKIGFLLYTLNPVTWFNSSVFGQFDGSGAFFGLLAAYLLLEKKKIFLAALSFAVAWAIKPQTIALAPPLGLIALLYFKPKDWFKGALAFITTTLLIYWPFFPNNPSAGVIYVFQQMANIYSCTTCFTFNFWGLLGNWRPDTTLFLGLPFLYWGIILFGLSLILLSRFKTANPYLVIALSVLSFNMLMTRMHERYVFPFFAFFLTAVILLKSKPLFIFYIFFSLFNTLNVYYPYAYYNPNFHLTPAFIVWLDRHFQLLSLIGFATFIFLLAHFIIAFRKFSQKAMKLTYPKTLFLLLLVSLFFRLFRLATPHSYVFDEVYHVPSIRAISQNNRAAYDPYAKAPEPNTAYDWLHPPLAKLIQAGSVKLLGDNSFAWRFPSAVFGTAAVAALYFLALTLFNSQPLALLAAAIFSFDNLQLTMSRIAMNDIFVTTWIIFALAFFYRFLKGPSFANAKVGPYWDLFLTGLFTGLALATKHSAILLYPIFLIFFIPKLIKNLKLFFPAFFCFLVIPALIYLLSYSQLFLQGGAFTDFYNLHKQIYWYQTHLTATHGYQSTAWQWPLLIRPVWFYVNYLKDSIANIYNLGNPAVFWGSLVAVFYLILKGPSFANAKVGPYWYVLISYFSLFFPFIFSPRIMFLHHYLPALAVLCVIFAKAVSGLPARNIKFIIVIIFITFIFFYPLNTALPLPNSLLKFWFWLPTWH